MKILQMGNFNQVERMFNPENSEKLQKQMSPQNCYAYEPLVSERNSSRSATVAAGNQFSGGKFTSRLVKAAAASPYKPELDSGKDLLYKYYVGLGLLFFF